MNFMRLSSLLLIVVLASCSPKTLPTGEVNYTGSTDTGTISLTSTGYYKGSITKAIEEAEKQAFETLLFRGVPGSQVPNAMIDTDESEIKSKYKDYFQDFYGNRRCRTFIMSSSKSSSGRKQSFTSVTLELKINFHALRKDLENKGLKRGFGL